MEEVFREALRLAEEDQPLVLCTVVRTRGSTPQKPGAMLLVREDGTGVGTLGGGCVEADVWAEARSALASGSGPGVGEFTLNDELAAESGMVCGGTMEIFVQPFPRSRDALVGPLREVLSAYEGGRGVAVAIPLSGARAGSLLLLREDGSRDGDLGAPALEERVARAARGLLVHGGTSVLPAEEGPELLVQAFVSPPHLVIGGAGHIGKALAAFAKSLGYRVTVIDDRAQFANRERFPTADAILVEEIPSGLHSLSVTPNTFIVVATRGHKLDDRALLEAVRSPAGYVGLVGSVRKTLLIYEELLAEGVPVERLRQVHAPVGLDIGARTPDEIALSILAEMTMVRLGGAGSPMKMAEKHFQKATEKAARAVAIRK
ncbi:MAG: XdhC family protein [Chloroflexi bacterium]|nr:XdhC family protein [Chloroflexota bacterium]